jgi:hypothetical protein
VQPRTLSQTDSIALRTDDGETLEMKVADSVKMPPGHLREHLVLAEPVTVTFVRRRDGLVATTIDD